MPKLESPGERFPGADETLKRLKSLMIRRSDKLVMADMQNGANYRREQNRIPFKCCAITRNKPL
jgi:hypothetical protein